MRLIDADELIEHAWRDKLDSRELIAKMIDNAPTVKEIPTKIPINVFERLISQESCEMTECRKYKKAFKIACELLNGGNLYGYDSDRIFSEMMEKDGVVSSDSYEEFILNNLDRLDGKV